MGYTGKGLFEKEGVIKRIESFGDDSGMIRIVVKTSFEGRAGSYHHAMLNIDDSLFVSLERYHSIITTYKELSAYLHNEVNPQNKECLYDAEIKFSRYATDINSVLRDIVTRPFLSVQSQTICRKKLRVDYDWVYISGLTMLSGDDHVNEYRKRIVDFLRDNLRKKYDIGNFRSQAMKLTRISENEKWSLIKFTEENKHGQWTLRSPRKLIYHNKMEKCIDYTFEYNYMIIADYAFSHFRNLTKITIPNSVVYLGNGAFFNCAKLNEIHLSKNLKSIGAQCFMGCNSLQYIVIPNSVTEIESEAFMDCKNLSNIAMPDNLKHIGWSVFNGCNKDINILINKEYEEELRKVLCAYTDSIVAIDSEEIEDMRSSEWTLQDSC